MKIRKSIILLLIMIISNAVFAQEMYSYTYQNTPEKDSITEAFLGDILAKQSYGIYVDCIIPKINFQKRALRSDFFIRKNSPICKRSAREKRYYFDYWPTEVAGNFPAVILEEKNDKYALKICLSGGGSCRKKIFKNIQKEDIKKDEVYFKTLSVSKKLNKDRQTNYDTQFQSSGLPVLRTIEYLSKKNNILKFVYFEYNDDASNPTNTRNFEIDLTEGNIIAYKGIILEVTDVTNVSIKYKVIKHFS